MVRIFSKCAREKIPKKVPRQTARPELQDGKVQQLENANCEIHLFGRMQGQLSVGTAQCARRRCTPSEESSWLKLGNRCGSPVRLPVRLGWRVLLNHVPYARRTDSSRDPIELSFRIQDEVLVPNEHDVVKALVRELS